MVAWVHHHPVACCACRTAYFGQDYYITQGLVHASVGVLARECGSKAEVKAYAVHVRYSGRPTSRETTCRAVCNINLQIRIYNPVAADSIQHRSCIVYDC